MNSFFVLVAAVLVVCVSAQLDRKKDTRPVCFKNMTTEEEKEKMDALKTCRDGLTEDQKKDMKTRIHSVLHCFLKAKSMLNENDEIIEASMEKIIENYGIEEYKPSLKALLKKCIATPKCEDYFKCVKENKKELPCKCPHHHYHGGMGRKGKEETESAINDAILL